MTHDLQEESQIAYEKMVEAVNHFLTVHGARVSEECHGVSESVHANQWALVANTMVIDQAVAGGYMFANWPPTMPVHHVEGLFTRGMNMVQDMMRGVDHHE